MIGRCHVVASYRIFYVVFSTLSLSLFLSYPHFHSTLFNTFCVKIGLTNWLFGSIKEKSRYMVNQVERIKHRISNKRKCDFSFEIFTEQNTDSLVNSCLCVCVCVCVFFACVVCVGFSSSCRDRYGILQSAGKNLICQRSHPSIYKSQRLSSPCSAVS